MARLPVLDYDAVLAAVTPQAAIDRVGEAFLRFASGDWVMPPKVYLRLTVRDLANNVAVAETAEPILIDLNEPEVIPISIKAAAAR